LPHCGNWKPIEATEAGQYTSDRSPNACQRRHRPFRLRQNCCKTAGVVNSTATTGNDQRGHQKDALQAGIVVHSHWQQEGLAEPGQRDSGNQLPRGFSAEQAPHPFPWTNLRAGARNDDQGFQETWRRQPHSHSSTLLAAKDGGFRRCDTSRIDSLHALKLC